MLHAAILRSGIAHGRIRDIDTSRARKIPGVHADVTAADLGTPVPLVWKSRDSSRLSTSSVGL